MKRSDLHHITARVAGHRPSRPAVVTLAVGVVLIAVLAATTVAVRPTVAGLLGLVVVATCLTALYHVTVSGSFAPVAVTFLAFVTVWVGFAPLLQIRDRRLPWPDQPLDRYYVTAQVILLLAVLAYLVGYTRRGTSRLRVKSPRFDITVEKAIVVTGLATVLAVVCLPRTGGVAVRFTDRDGLRNAIAQEGLTGGRDQAMLGLLSTLPAAVSLVALVLCLVCWRNGAYADQRARWILVAATSTAVCLNVVYNNPLSANRFASFSVLLAAALALLRFDRQWWRSLFSLGMLLGLAIIYPLFNLFRNERSRSNLRLGTDAYYTYDFDGFQQTVNAVNYVDEHGHTWGHHLMSALLVVIPRSWWEGKAIPAGNVVAANRGYDFQNLALPFWAEVFLEFTVVGVVVLFVVYGWLARRLDATMGASPAGLATTVTVMFAACQIGLLRGPLGAQIPFVGAAFAVLLVAVLGWRGRSWHLTRVPEIDPVAPTERRVVPTEGESREPTPA